jgi:hypothetical protein
MSKIDEKPLFWFSVSSRKWSAPSCFMGIALLLLSIWYGFIKTGES